MVYVLLPRAVVQDPFSGGKRLRQDWQVPSDVRVLRGLATLPKDSQLLSRTQTGGTLSPQLQREMKQLNGDAVLRVGIPWDPIEFINKAGKSLDADATTRPSICADIREWDYRTYPPGHFDLIWASPVCTEFSRALTRRPRRVEDGDRLVLKTIEVIGYLRPRWWAVENPRTGLLKSRPYMRALPYDDVSYCRYGFRYQKTTRIWNNLPWVPSQAVCSKRSRCEAFQDGRHPAGQPALARPDPGPAVLPAAPAVPGDRTEPKWEK